MFTPDVKKIISGRATAPESTATSALRPRPKSSALDTSGVRAPAEQAPENKFSEHAMLKSDNDDKTIDAIYRACREQRPGTICPNIKALSRKEQQTPWIKQPRKYESSTKGLVNAVFIVQGEDAYIGNLAILGSPQRVEIMCDGNQIYQTCPLLEKTEGKVMKLNFPRIFLPRNTSIEILVKYFGHDPVLYADVYYVSEEEIERATKTPRDIEILQNYVVDIAQRVGYYGQYVDYDFPIFDRSYLYRVVFGGKPLNFAIARFTIGNLSFCYDPNQAMLDSKDFSGSLYSMTFSDEPPFSKMCRDLNVSGEDMTFSLEKIDARSFEPHPDITLCLQFLGKLRYMDGVYKLL